ncbi:DUF664 domain-containing protein [Gordonia pseudamarae]|jgi:hypothetical protein|uniref:DUF664 domain-containing protein n=1 Tax=Gordonia pseudamarae TaxID=2831662 RepID=A0ABX6IGG7_9ACTN|nr:MULTISPECIES: DUF664 domain-containing protein [Gordonia]MBD0023512.1 DinB family protein [Gordonia sp. (in: high G+C Gram-positive bacteria)]QHN26041.1 DUF664 domain-containing protein [Gordonia pseudamarae]QHN34966.1 DUF664 domain-containing protein [Gordonia pseudamarae]
MGLYTAVTVPDVTGEKRELLTVLADQRNLFRVTVRNLTEVQARQRTTVSELTLGGLVKHLASGARGTASVITERDENATLDMTRLEHDYDLLPDETFEAVLAEFDAATEALDAVIIDVPSLDDLIPQPTAPWAPERTWESVRMMVLNKIREYAHHSGHADIIREALDGQNTMAAISEGQDWAAAMDWT